MGSITDALGEAFRDYVTDGVPATGANKPSKAEIRSVGSLIEAAIGTAVLGSVGVSKDTRAHLNADLVHAADTIALVYADGTDANNDLYVKVGASGSGSWTLTSILHDAIEGLAQPYVDAAEAAQAAAETAAASFATTQETARRFFYPPRVVFMGDSGTEYNHIITGSSPNVLLNTQPWGEVNWAHSLWPYFSWENWVDSGNSRGFNGCNQGVIGNTSTQMLARFAAVEAMAPDIVGIRGFGNDLIGGGYVQATTMANIDTMVKRTRAIGATPLLATVTPGIGSSDGAHFAAWDALNTAIRAYCTANNVALWDIAPIYDAGSGVPKTNYYRDNFHASARGAIKGGLSLVPVLKQLIKPVFDAVPAGAGIAVNSLMTGTSGTRGAGVTGNVATGWNLTIPNGTSAVAASKDGNDAQVLTFTPNAANEYDLVILAQASNITLVTGKWYRVVLEFDVTPWNGWFGIGAELQTGGNTMISQSDTWQVDYTGATSLHFVGDPFQAGLTTINSFDVRAVFRSDATGPGTVTIKRAAVIESADPRPYFGL